VDAEHPPHLHPRSPVDGVDGAHVGDGVLAAGGLWLSVEDRCDERFELVDVGGSAVDLLGLRRPFRVYRQFV